MYINMYIYNYIYIYTLLLEVIYCVYIYMIHGYIDVLFLCVDSTGQFLD